MSITTTDLIGLLSKIELDNNYQELEVMTPREKDNKLVSANIDEVHGVVIIYPSGEGDGPDC